MSETSASHKLTRRDFGKLTLASVPLAGLIARPEALFGLQAKPIQPGAACRSGSSAVPVWTRSRGLRRRAEGARQVRREQHRTERCARRTLCRRAAAGAWRRGRRDAAGASRRPSNRPRREPRPTRS